MDLSQLTLGEVAKIEELSGLSLVQIDNDDSPKGKALAAIALVLKRRAGFPAFTWNEAQALTMPEVQELLAGLGIGNDEGIDDDPKDESGETALATWQSSSSSASALPSTGD